MQDQKAKEDQFLAEDFQDEFLVGMGITDVKDQGEEEKEFEGQMGAGKGAE